MNSGIAFKKCFDRIGSFKFIGNAEEDIKTEQDRWNKIISSDVADEKQQGQDKKQQDDNDAPTDYEESMSKLAWFILDCLSINHNNTNNNCNDKIDSSYFWTLGDATYLSQEGIIKLKNNYEKNIPIKQYRMWCKNRISS